MNDRTPIVLVTRKMPPAVEARLQRDYDVRFNPDDRLLSADELVARSEGVDAILPCYTEGFSADVIARLPDSVRIIATYSVGHNHIDVAAARDRGIVVTNTPDVLSDATAEVAILLMLGAARRAAEGERLMRDGAWQSWSPNFMTGTQVTGKRFGVVGMGRIGRIAARRARGFDMEIHYYNRSRLPAAHEEDAIYHPTVEDLLPHCDVLSLHCPVTPETYHLLNKARIDLLPPHAIVVNTARGEIVDDDALISALTEGRIAAAGLDVFENEPDIDSRYASLWNTFLLPHLGSATVETRNQMGFRALDNVDAYFRGVEPRDRVV
ncbi:MAG: D-glycerate dehydrogenase [Alphaproteobacteria bacterium]|nr:D-glycerate dehydrogenase [Alphaproteobacteria bacterium]